MDGELERENNNLLQGAKANRSVIYRASPIKLDHKDTNDKVAKPGDNKQVAIMRIRLNNVDYGEMRIEESEDEEPDAVWVDIPEEKVRFWREAQINYEQAQHEMWDAWSKAREELEMRDAPIDRPLRFSLIRTKGLNLTRLHMHLTLLQRNAGFAWPAYAYFHPSFVTKARIEIVDGIEYLKLELWNLRAEQEAAGD